MTPLSILLVIAMLVAVFALRSAWDRWAYTAFYLRGRSEDQRADADKWRNRAMVVMLAGIILRVASQRFPAVHGLVVASACTLSLAVLLLIRAGQRVSTGRTLLSLAAIGAALGLTFVSIKAGWLPLARGVAPVVPWRVAVSGAGIIGLLLIAARLSRPDHLPPDDG